MPNQEPPLQETPATIPSKASGDYTMVAHPILRHWMAILSGDAFKAFCCVIDKTWGWHKQEACISLSDFKRAMGIPAKHDEKVYRALRELLFFGVIAEGKTVGKFREKSYFVTAKALATNTPLAVKNGRMYLDTNRGLVDLLTLREELHSHHVSTTTNDGLVDADLLLVRQAAHDKARAKSSQRAKDTSLKKGKRKGKINS